MDGTVDEEAIGRAVAEACAACQIHGDDAFLVASLLERPRAAWPSCCGSGCDPCMDDILVAVEHALALLGSKDPLRR